MGEVKQVLVIRKDLNMRKGKMVAQGAHSAMKFLIDNNVSDTTDKLIVELSPAEAQWIFGGSFTKIVVGCDSEDELKQLVLQAKLKNIEVHEIIDAGRTEFHGEPTLTCAAFGPEDSELLDEVTGSLKPL
jgi:PTH2 family peptidyl-tRNA hydrolase